MIASGLSFRSLYKVIISLGQEGLNLYLWTLQSEVELCSSLVENDKEAREMNMKKLCGHLLEVADSGSALNGSFRSSSTFRFHD